MSTDQIETRALIRFWLKMLIRYMDDDDTPNIYAVKQKLDRIQQLTDKLVTALDKSPK